MWKRRLGKRKRRPDRGWSIADEVAGRKQYSNVRVFGQTPDSSDSAGRFAYGKKVQVAYCPTDPDLAVLEPGITNDAYYLPAGGAAFFFGIPALTRM